MKKVSYGIIGLMLVIGCQSVKKQQTSAPRVVSIDSTFNEYFLPKGDEYTGADGAYSVLLPDGSTVWIWGDTFLGNVTEDMKRIKTDPLYIRNSFTRIEKNGTLSTFHQGEPHEFKSMMIPPDVADGSSGMTEEDVWYWPGDGFVENGQLKVFVSRFAQEEEGMWGFRFKKTELMSFSLTDFDVEEVVAFGDFDGIHFGHALCPTESYTYIYGLKEQNPYVARVKSGNVTGDWEYYNGENWTAEVTDAKTILMFSGSEQFSVFQHEGKYIMIMQEGGFGKRIYSFVSETPYGPWTNQKMVYETPLPADEPNLFTYNALAHPQYMEDNMLLISYNTNSMELADHYEDALIYRPRFIRVPMEFILD